MSAWIEIVALRVARCVVALLVSAWIEIPMVHKPKIPLSVALLVSAWIEMHSSYVPLL